ncbi:MAG: hypothetical protein PHS60_06410 [Zavarzinia sp.]|nr:hypothetical protein [Zavarzinia sp.]
MGTAYQVSPLKAARVDAAFPLAQACLGAPDLATWRATAARFAADAGSGLIVAEREGYIRGLAAYSLVPAISGGRELVVHALGVLELLFPERAALALADAMRAVARAQDCAEIVFAVPDDSAWLTALLSDHAWHEAGRVMVGHRAVTIEGKRPRL